MITVEQLKKIMDDHALAFVKTGTLHNNLGRTSALIVVQAINKLLKNGG